MSTSDETQRGQAGARTTTTPRDAAGSGPEPETAPGAAPEAATGGTGTKRPRRGSSGRGQPGGDAPTAPTAATSSTSAPPRTGTGPGRPESVEPGAGKAGAGKSGAEKTAAGKTASGKPAGGKPAGAAAAGTAGAGAASATATAAGRPAAPRRVRLTVARLDPWSVMKLSFLLSVALGIAFVVASGVLWSILDGMGVYTDVSRVVGEIIGDGSFDLTVWAGFGRTLSLVTVLAVVNVVLLTAISTLGAFLYNISAALVGGLHVTLSDD